MSEPQIYWAGKSGEKYGYWIYKIEDQFDDTPGNYIYTKKTNGDKWILLYIGQTSSLKDRLSNHEKEAFAKRNGATHIHTHTNPASEEMRKKEEVDLIKCHGPVCNKQHT